MHSSFFRKVFGVHLFIIFTGFEVRAQFNLQGPFQYAQFGFFDSTAGIGVHTDFLYPAAGLKTDKTFLISLGKLLEVPGYAQLIGQYLWRKKQQAVGLQVSFDKQVGASQLQMGIQMVQALKEGVDLGVIIGITQASYIGYVKNSLPFGKVGLQTSFSEKLLGSFALKIDYQSLPWSHKKKFFPTSVLAGTQVKISSLVAASLHLQKVENFPVEWMAFLCYRPVNYFAIQCGFSPSPQWWVFQFSFLFSQFKTQLSTGVHPLAGVVSIGSFQLSSRLK